MSARRLPPPRVKPLPTEPKHPWLLPAITTVALVVVVAGVIWAALLGRLF